MKFKYLLPVSFVIMLLFLGIAYVYQQTIVSSSKQDAFNRFVYSAELKVEQLTHWYADELLDAKILSENYELVRRLSYLIEREARSFDEGLLHRWLNSTMIEHTFSDILIISTQGEILYSANNYINKVHDEILLVINEIEIEQDVLSTNFYCDDSNEITISFVGPVFNNQNEILAFVSFNINTQEYLFPQIEKPYVGMSSSKAFIANVESDSIFMLNVPCSNENRAYRVGAYLHDSGEFSSFTDPGFGSIFHEISWFDDEVVIYIEEVPKTDWILISKINKHELYGHIISRSITFYLFLFAVFVALIIAIYTAYLYVSREQSKGNQKQIEEQKRQLQTLLSNLPGMAYRCKNDFKWTMEYVSYGCNELLGFSPDEIINNRIVAFADLISPDDKEKIAEVVEAALSIKSNFEVEYRIQHKNGSIKWIWERGCGVYDNSGQLMAVEGFISDISLRVAAEEQMKYNHNLLNTIIENIPDAVYLKDKQGRKIIANRADLDNMGVENLEDVIGKTDYDIFPDFIAREFEESEKAVLKEGKSVINRQEKLENINGNIKWLNTSKIPFKDEDGEILGLIGIGHDNTEKIKMMEELIIAKEKAEESDLLKTSFLANMSHEIRTPLNSILGFTDLIIQLHETEQAEKESYSSIVKRNADSLLQIINDVIDISSLETGQMKIMSSTFSINILLEVIYNEFESDCTMCGGNSLELKLLNPGEDIKVDLDKNRVSQILTNLITNAMKFTEKGYIEFGITHYDETYIHFKVEDTGIGIPDEKQDFIFERFRQVSDNLTQQKGGNGLGLSIVKNLVELMGGEIEVESEVGKGSCFRFYLSRKLSTS